MAGKAIVRRSMFKFRYMQLYFKRNVYIHRRCTIKATTTDKLIKWGKSILNKTKMFGV